MECRLPRQVEISYIKLVNLSSHVIVHNLFGRCATNVLPFLMAVHVGCPRRGRSSQGPSGAVRFLFPRLLLGYT